MRRWPSLGVLSKPIAIILYAALLVGALSAWAGPSSSPSTGADLRSPERQQDVAIVIEILSVVYDPGSNQYQVALTISDPVYIRRLILLVEDADSGVQQAEQFIVLDNKDAVQSAISAQTLVPARSYVLKVLAEDGQGNLLQRNEEFGSQTDRTIFAIKTFTHEPPQAPPVAAEVESVTPDFENDTLTITLDVSEPERILKYEGYVVADSGQRALDIAPTLFDPATPSFQVPLPPEMENPATASGYLLTLLLTTHDNQETRVEREFAPTPPPRPGLIRRVLSIFTTNMSATTAILIILLTLMTWRMLSGRSKPKKKPLPRPPVEHTQVLMNRQEGARSAPPSESVVAPPSPPPPSTPQLLLTVVQSPDSTVDPTHLLEDFPATIGRIGATVSFKEDAQISRAHAQITLENGTLYLSDLGSTNGTFVNKRALEANKKLPLRGKKRVWFGRHTECEIEVRG